MKTESRRKRNKKRIPSPLCPSCGADWDYRTRPEGTSGEADYYGCRNGHEWDVRCSWRTPSLIELSEVL